MSKKIKEESKTNKGLYTFGGFLIVTSVALISTLLPQTTRSWLILIEIIVLIIGAMILIGYAADNKTSIFSTYSWICFFLIFINLYRTCSQERSKTDILNAQISKLAFVYAEEAKKAPFSKWEDFIDNSFEGPAMFFSIYDKILGYSDKDSISFDGCNCYTINENLRESLESYTTEINRDDLPDSLNCNLVIIKLIGRKYTHDVKLDYGSVPFYFITVKIIVYDIKSKIKVVIPDIIYGSGNWDVDLNPGVNTLSYINGKEPTHEEVLEYIKKYLPKF